MTPVVTQGTAPTSQVISVVDYSKNRLRDVHEAECCEPCPARLSPDLALPHPFPSLLSQFVQSFQGCPDPGSISIPPRIVTVVGGSG